MNNSHIYRAILIGSLVLLASSSATVADSTSPTGSGKSSARFVVSADAQTVQDVETTLIWQRSQSPVGVTWKGAYNYCGSLKIADLEREWRLPSLAELQSLIVEAKKPSLMYIDPEAFPHTPSEFFWTASANDTQVAAVFFDMSSYPTGLDPDKTLGNVRCVRGILNPEYKVPDAASYNLMTIPRPASRYHLSKSIVSDF